MVQVEQVLQESEPVEEDPDQTPSPEQEIAPSDAPGAVLNALSASHQSDAAEAMGKYQPSHNPQSPCCLHLANA